LTLTSFCSSLNHIFLLEEEALSGLSGVQEIIDRELWALIWGEIKTEFKPEALSDGDILECNRMSKAARCTVRECKALLKQWHRTMEDNNILLEVFQSIVNQPSSEASKTGADEDSFVHKVLAPVLSPFFSDSDVVECTWANTTLSASSHRKKKFDPSLKGRKPDFAVFTSGLCKMHLLVTEVKPPRHCATAKDLWSDLVKLGNELKDVIDTIADKDVGTAVVVCGLLVEGFRCDLFVMDLKYEAIYRMIHLGRFYLPRDRCDFDVLSNAIEVLLQTKTIVTRSAKVCITKFRNTHTRQGTPPPTSNMTRPSFHTPMKVPIASRTIFKRPQASPTRSPTT